MHQIVRHYLITRLMVLYLKLIKHYPPKYVTTTTRTTAMIAFKTVTKSATVDGIQKTPSIKTPSIRTQTNLNYLLHLIIT